MLKKIFIAFGFALFFGSCAVASAADGILKITQFSANPDKIDSGQTSTLTWKTELATACEARNFTGWGQTESLDGSLNYKIPTNGSVTIKPSVSKTYQVICSSPYSSTHREITVIVNGIVGDKVACEDGIDNDGDGKTDYPSDPGCTEAKDADEKDDAGSKPGEITDEILLCLKNKGIEVTDAAREGAKAAIQAGQQMSKQAKAETTSRVRDAIEAYRGVLSDATIASLLGKLSEPEDLGEKVTKSTLTSLALSITQTTRASQSDIQKCIYELAGEIDDGGDGGGDLSSAADSVSSKGAAAPSAASASAPVSFSRDLSLGSEGDDVLALQKILNSNPATQIAETGAGSPGQETSYFGSLTQAAVKKFQELNADKILTPLGLTSGTGYVGESTRAVLSTMSPGASASSGVAPTPAQQANNDAIQAQIAALMAQVATLQTQLAAQMPAGS